MTRRPIRRLAVALPACGALLLASPSSAAAAPAGDPHAEGVKGTPHAADAHGAPHADSSDTSTEPTTAAPVVEESTTSSNNTGGNVTVSSPSASLSTVTLSAAAGPSGGGGGGGGGKPPDGSVGNANGKQPPGQLKNGGEKGHACDGNKGIGKGNPAHSGCTTTTTTTTTPTTTETTPTTDTTTPTVLGETFDRPAKVLGVTVTRGSLARTGSTPLGDPLGLTVVAFSLMGLGVGFRRWGANRTT